MTDQDATFVLASLRPRKRPVVPVPTLSRPSLNSATDDDSIPFRGSRIDSGVISERGADTTTAIGTVFDARSERSERVEKSGDKAADYASQKRGE